jgi:hypothetical protein
MEESFTTSEGLVVPLRRVARRHVERVRAKHVIPDPPTYSFEAAGGVTVTKDHDETTLESPEDHKAWNEYRAARLEAIMAQEAEIAKFLIFNCVAMDPPPVKEWSVDFGMWDIEPPDDSDPLAFKLEWFESEVMVNDQDSSKILARLYEMGGLVDSDQVTEMESFFRAVLEGVRTAAGS